MEFSSLRAHRHYPKRWKIFFDSHLRLNVKFNYLALARKAQALKLGISYPKFHRKIHEIPPNSLNIHHSPKNLLKMPKKFIKATQNSKVDSPILGFNKWREHLQNLEKLKAEGLSILSFFSLWSLPSKLSDRCFRLLVLVWLSNFPRLVPSTNCDK